MEDKVYWKGLEELEQNSQQNDKEFADELPVLGSIMEPITTQGTTSRRDFLKMLGFSTTAAVVAAGCEMPVRKSIPYAFKPEEVTPGIANYYATATYQGGEYNAVLVKTREGRPIKIEGNSLATVSKGGTSSRIQASVLSLYDGGRYKNPMKGKENITWEVADKEIGEKLKNAGGKIVIYSATIPSPSTLAAIEEFKKAYGAEHLVSDAISYSGLLDASEKAFGTRAIPSFAFNRAKVIVGIGCDFLGTWLSPTEFAKDWANGRKLSGKGSKMNRHIQVESALTMTGAAADKRIAVKPSEEATFVADLAAAINGGSSGNAKADSVAKELLAAKGASLVVSGSNDANVQTVVLAINQALGNVGVTVNKDVTYNTKQGTDKAATELVSGLESGAIKAVIFYGSNPVLTHPLSAKLKDAIKKAAVSVSFSEVADETSELCSYVCPDNHWLESWNDISPKTGVYNITQPTITKLFNTRQAQETLLTWSGNKTSFYDYIRANWDKTISGKQSKFTGFNALWDVTVHDGELVTGAAAAINGEEGMAEGGAAGGSVSADAAISAIKAAYGNLGDTQLKVYESAAIGDGTWAGNPFQQENPDPITKITWGNVVLTSVNWRRKNNVKNDLELKDYQLVKVTANGQSVTLPAVAVPGVADGTFAIAVGYGKTVTNGAAGDDLKVGQNVYPLLGLQGDNYSFISKATVEILSKEEKVAITQSHHNIVLKDLGGIKKRHIVKETTLPEYLESPDAGNEDRKEILEELVTLYYKHDRPGHHWNMSIDLTSCIGCGACVTACNIENNVPVVGKDQVIRSREMHWLRIDRYFTFDVMEENATDPDDKKKEALSPEKVDVVFQPMLCQHCDNAPCENVCPVAATSHSSEGLNQMTYNRCIGTRYCANNCPYKVRRFNWYDYQAADSFDGKRVGKMWANEGLLSDATRSLHEPLARMVLNPDVTVRSRGVIEKCSFCVQRIQEGKLTAKKENRPLKDGEVKTACQTACPTDGIVFGDRNNKDSHIAIRLNDPRTFGVIEEIHTMPNVTYLTKVRNREAAPKTAEKEA